MFCSFWNEFRIGISRSKKVFPNLKKELKRILMRVIKPRAYRYFEVQLINEEIHENMYYFGQEDELEYEFDVLNQYQFNEDEDTIDTEEDY